VFEAAGHAEAYGRLARSGLPTAGPLAVRGTLERSSRTTTRCSPAATRLALSRWTAP
jgi:hypothetical protein